MPYCLLLAALLLPATALAQWLPDTFATHLPLLLINAAGPIVDEPKVMATLRLIDNGPDSLNHAGDAASGYDGWVGIEVRGQSSQNWAKKSFGIETRWADGSNRNVSLLGLPEENDWVLYAPYFDRTLLRNVLVYGLGAELFAYSPRTRLVEVGLNGFYHGVYVLTEKIKRDPQRVDIAKLEVDPTGGYLLRIDKGADSTNAFPSAVPAPGTDTTVFFQYHDPKPDELSAAQKDYIQDYVARAEAALAGPWFKHPQLGYAAYFDVPSLVDYFLLSELTRNVDAYRISTYLYKHADGDGGKLHLGPVWDYNLALGNILSCDSESTEGWAYELNAVCPTTAHPVPFWWARLRTDPAFERQLRARYTELRETAWSTSRLAERLAAYADHLGEAAQRNRARWPIGSDHAAFEGATYADELLYLENWIADRLAWLDEQLELSDDVHADPHQTLTAVEGPPNADWYVRCDNAGHLYVGGLDRPARLELFDLRGVRLGSFPVAPVGEEQLLTRLAHPPGVYLTRLRDDRRTYGGHSVVLPGRGR